MIPFVFGLALVLLGVLCWILASAYRGVSAVELKRQARRGDEIAALLYRTAAYGLSATIVLAVLSLACLYGGYVLLVNGAGKWLAFPVVAVLLLLGFVVVRSEGGVKRASLRIAAWVSPALAWLSEQLNPVLGLVERVVRRIFPIHFHSGLYEKSDLVKLLEQQKHQADNRIPAGELDIAAHALTFSDQTVADTLVPKRIVKSVAVGEPVGPLLMSELHATGHSRFPVYEGQKDKIIGVLYLHDLVAVKQTGTVRDVMRPKVVFVHEEFTLYQALQAFLKTKQHLFVVVNAFEEYVGIITVEDVLERIIGAPIVDEFDRYEDLRAVAAAAAAREHRTAEKTHQEPVVTAPDTSPAKD